MTRSIWKGKFLDNSLTKIDKIKKLKSINVYSRRSVIYPFFINKRVNIYNGNKFIPIKINSDMIGHKFGEFSFTRAMYVFKGKKNKKKK